MEHPQMNPTPTPNSPAPVDTTVDLIQIRICRACRDGIGSECHTPECALFLHKVDLPIDPNLYEVVPEKSDSQSVDIARLRELLEKATPGPWSVRKAYFDRNKRSADADYEIFPHTDGRKKPKGCGEWTELCECKSYDEKNKKNADLIAALRNAAPALLDEVERLRADCAEMRLAIKWVVSDYDEDGNVTGGVVESCRIAIEDKETKITGMEGTCAARLDALTEIEAERDKLREEVERLKLGKENLRDALGQMTSERDHASKVRDSLRQQNERLLEEIEELKANQKESQ